MTRYKNMLIVLLLAVSFTAAAQIRERIQQRRASQNNASAPSSPDYSNLFYWAAHPWKKDMSDSVAPFFFNEKRDTLADVFFLHPTTFIKDIRNAAMNADVNDETLNKETDEKTILNQASVFNNCARIFAPRYRQAHLKAYFRPASMASKEAFDTAYADLQKAFQYYLDHYNNGRPIIIAAHSQGAMHAVRLMKDFFDGKALQKQLVCAYIVGWQIKTNEFAFLKAGEKPGDTNCFVGWRSFKAGENSKWAQFEKGGSVCVNPVSWTSSQDKIPKEQSKGAVGKNLSKECNQCIATQVSPSGILWIELPEEYSQQFERLKNFHIGDYNLFYKDIRENAALRVNTFLKKK